MRGASLSISPSVLTVSAVSLSSITQKSIFSLKRYFCFCAELGTFLQVTGFPRRGWFCPGCGEALWTGQEGADCMWGACPQPGGHRGSCASCRARGSSLGGSGGGARASSGSADSSPAPVPTTTGFPLGTAPLAGPRTCWGSWVLAVGAQALSGVRVAGGAGTAGLRAGACCAPCSSRLSLSASSDPPASGLRSSWAPLRKLTLRTALPFPSRNHRLLAHVRPRPGSVC